ncbi:BTB And Kelch [Ostertagia ostertagi]
MKLRFPFFSLQEQCSEFLEKQLNASNCLKIRAFADTYACEELLRCASEFILHNFKDVIGTDEFYRLPGNQLIELISSEELQVPSEEQVFKAVVEWVRFDLPARRLLFPEVMAVFFANDQRYTITL